MKPILAIDGGGTRTRCLLIDGAGNTLGSGSGGPSNHLLVDRETVRRSLIDATAFALAGAGMQSDEVSIVSAGLAGVDYNGNGAAEMAELLNDIGFANTLIEGDMVIAHTGALAGEPGVLALAGTGSSVLGVGEDGRRIKIGGWGPVFGDEGSAYRIGQAALRAAARDFDGRGPMTGLTSAVVEDLGINNFGESIDAVYLRPMEPRQIARLSEVVNRCAGSGDRVAIDILTSAGGELAECAAAAVRRLGISVGTVKVSYQGSVVTASEIVRESFCRAVSSEVAEVTVTAPRFPPVIGAYLLGRTAIGLLNREEILTVLAEPRTI
jgi:N-acetylglucosamine kinase